jgi:uncharacterized protein (TIGR02246 family)
MSTPRPQDLNRQLIEELTRGDIEAILSHYEPDALFSPQPGQTAVGLDAIREAFEGFVAMKPQVSYESADLIAQAGDLAITSVRNWVVRGTGPDGSPVEFSGSSAEVVRRQPDGSWRYVLDFMFGIPA